MSATNKSLGSTIDWGKFYILIQIKSLIAMAIFSSGVQEDYQRYYPYFEL